MLYRDILKEFHSFLKSQFVYRWNLEGWQSRRWILKKYSFWYLSIERSRALLVIDFYHEFGDDIVRTDKKLYVLISERNIKLSKAKVFKISIDKN